MRAAGIVKIVIGSVLVVMLVSVMLGVIGGRFVWENFGIEERVREEIVDHLPSNAQSNAERDTPASGSGSGTGNGTEGGSGAVAGNGTGPQTVVGSASFAAANVHEIDVEWISGEVVLSIGEGTEVQVSESSTSELSDAQRMRCTLKEGKLKIKYCDDADNVWSWFIRGNYRIPSKTLYLTLPASLMATLSELDIETVSADVHFDAANTTGKDVDISSTSGDVTILNLEARDISASSISGRVTIENCASNELDVETVSGRVAVKSGSYAEVDAQTVSGDIELACTTAPKKMDAETVSGKISVWLPADTEFTARLSTVSGKLSSEIPGVMTDNQLTSGSGANRYTFESVSGSVKILAKP